MITALCTSTQIRGEGGARCVLSHMCGRGRAHGSDVRKCRQGWGDVAGSAVSSVDLRRRAARSSDLPQPGRRCLELPKRAELSSCVDKCAGGGSYQGRGRKRGQSVHDLAARSAELRAGAQGGERWRAGARGCAGGRALARGCARVRRWAPVCEVARAILTGSSTRRVAVPWRCRPAGGRGHLAGTRAAQGGRGAAGYGRGVGWANGPRRRPGALRRAV